MGPIQREKEAVILGYQERIEQLKQESFNLRIDLAVMNHENNVLKERNNSLKDEIRQKDELILKLERKGY